MAGAGRDRRSTHLRTWLLASVAIAAMTGALLAGGVLHRQGGATRRAPVADGHRNPAAASSAAVGATPSSAAVGATVGSAPVGATVGSAPAGATVGSAPAGVAAAIAAAYHYPRACLNVTIAAGDPSYARARLDRASPCWRYGVYVTAIFHRVGGAWQQVLDANSYPCPVSWLPPVVQTQLSVCPGRR